MVWISVIFGAAVTAAASAGSPLLQAAPPRKAAPPAVLRKSRRDQPSALLTIPLNLRQPTLAAALRALALPAPIESFVQKKVPKRREESARCEQCPPVPEHGA